QREPEVRVVVDRIDGDGLGELAPGPRHPSRLVQGSAQRLADRSLLGLDELGLRKQHRGLMWMPFCEEPAGLAEQAVRRLLRFRRAIGSGCHASHRSPVFCSILRASARSTWSRRRLTTRSHPTRNDGSTRCLRTTWCDSSWAAKSPGMTNNETS